MRLDKKGRTKLSDFIITNNIIFPQYKKNFYFELTWLVAEDIFIDKMQTERQ
jgi:hypothetical protein